MRSIGGDRQPSALSPGTHNWGLAAHREEVQVEDCDDRQEQEGEQEGEDVEEPQSTELLLLSAVVAS